MSDCSLPQLSLLHLSLVREGSINFHVGFFLFFFSSLGFFFFLRIHLIWGINFTLGQDKKDP